MDRVRAELERVKASKSAMAEERARCDPFRDLIPRSPLGETARASNHLAQDPTLTPNPTRPPPPPIVHKPPD